MQELTASSSAVLERLGVAGKGRTCSRASWIDDALAQRPLQQAQRKLHQQRLVQRRGTLGVIALAAPCRRYRNHMSEKFRVLRSCSSS